MYVLSGELVVDVAGLGRKRFGPEEVYHEAFIEAVECHLELLAWTREPPAPCFAAPPHTRADSAGRLQHRSGIGPRSVTLPSLTSTSIARGCEHARPSMALARSTSRESSA